MTPREELAGFIADRGHCWLSFGADRQALESLAWASALVPRNESYLYTTWTHLNRWRDKLNAQKPSAFPEINVGLGQRRFPESLPRNIEVGILSLEVTELILTNEIHEKKWLGALRKGLPADAPTAVFADFSPNDKYDEWRMQFKYAQSAPPRDTVRENSSAQSTSSPNALSATFAAHNQFCFSIMVGANDHDV